MLMMRPRLHVLPAEEMIVAAAVVPVVRNVVRNVDDSLLPATEEIKTYNQ